MDGRISYALSECRKCPFQCLFREHPCNSCHRAGGRSGRKTARFRGNGGGTAVA